MQTAFSGFMAPRRFRGAHEALRQLRYEPALGSQHPAITLGELDSWAGQHCQAVSVPAMQTYIQLLSNFSSSNKPLAPNKNATAVFEDLARSAQARLTW